MDIEKVLEILKNHRESNFKVEYKDEDGVWWEIYKDQPIRILFEYEIRIVKK